uniref:Annexin n=1 Tax=Callorhinchus milii TaxID=7868 RepID=K4FXS5_CALMI|nr:annexin max1 [Callorhinchus milii]|eukprot:gi/632972715/ref/XP_007902795.1/ PREDICTED: annexin A5-like [Callorhinchus milii]
MSFKGGAGQCRGTVVDFQDFNSKEDAENLHQAMQGAGTDEASILEILTKRSNAQRQEINLAYKTMLGKDLTDDLKSDLSGYFESLIVALMLPADRYDAKELHDALKGSGTSEDVLIEILASRSNAEIQRIVELYKEDFDSKLEDDILGDTSGYFERVLVSLLQGNRDEGGADSNQATQDAKDLFEAGENAWGTDEEKFIIILCSRSIPHLQKVFDEYKRLTDKDLEDSIQSECSGSLQTSLVAIVKCVKNTPAYFAEKLYNSMKGAGTDEKTLIRIVVSRSEKDMMNIKDHFLETYEETLQSTIIGDTGGDCQKALVNLCGGED